MRQVVSFAGLMFFVVACAALTPNSHDPQESSHVSMTRLVDQLAPMLRDAKSAARIDYRADCDVSTGFGVLSFPDVRTRTPLRGVTGLDAIRSLLPADAVAMEKPGIVSIKLGGVSDAILNTRIRHLEFTPDEQFTDSLAILAIYRNPDVQAVSKTLGYTLPIEDISIMPVSAREGLPHLPQTLSGLTLDQALDEVAKTFGAIVFFGACEDHLLYSIQSRRF